MFSVVDSFFLLIPAIIYLIVIGFVIWLIIRLIRSNEKIAANTERIARVLEKRSQKESDN